MFNDDWLSTGDVADDVAKILVGTDEQSFELRQNSPFAGVLPDRQRQQVLRSFRQHWQRTQEREHAM